MNVFKCLSGILITLFTLTVIISGVYFEVDNNDINKLFRQMLTETIEHDNNLIRVHFDFLNFQDYVRHFNSSGLLDFVEKEMSIKDMKSLVREKRQEEKEKNSHSLGLMASDNSRVIDAISTIGLRVSRNISQALNSTGNNKQKVLRGLKAPSDFCPFQNVPNCKKNAPFRTVDGSCNNIANPWWGKSEIPYKRIFPPVYSDGIMEARSESVTGAPLPNPRVISRKLSDDNGITENKYSHIFPIFGQFLAHDITSAAITTESSGKITDCPCDTDNPACLSVKIPETDNILTQSCMKMTRSSAAFSTFDCRLGSREQLNLLSAFIDGSNIYGATEKRSKDLRTMEGGLLKTSPGVGNHPFLMQAPDGSCRDVTPVAGCFKGGEGRTNENLALTSLQTLFTREHNRLAGLLAEINPNWQDERIYQEAKKIVVGMIQHITYNEYLPLVVGTNVATSFDLFPQKTNNFYTGYSETINPSLSNEFTTAAFRFGHTFVRNKLTRVNEKHVHTGEVVLSQISLRPVEAFNKKAGGIDSILLGLLDDPSSKFDTHFANTMQNHLFEIKLPNGKVIAIDLAATNINRGRDHGIPPYTVFREHCGLRKATTFEDLSDSVSAEQIKKLSEVYDDVNDIDLYIGGLSETPFDNAAVGVTFSCLIAKQFSDLKNGDRFYYENGPSNTAFTLPQLKQIKSVTLTSIICSNSDAIDLQPRAFEVVSAAGNQRVKCDSVPQLNIAPWTTKQAAAKNKLKRTQTATTEEPSVPETSASQEESEAESNEIAPVRRNIESSSTAFTLVSPNSTSASVVSIKEVTLNTTRATVAESNTKSVSTADTFSTVLMRSKATENRQQTTIKTN